MKIERGGSCNTSNIIYAAECRKHRKLCIGQSKNQVNRGFCGHIKKLISDTSDSDVGGTNLKKDQQDLKASFKIFASSLHLILFLLYEYNAMPRPIFSQCTYYIYCSVSASFQ